MQCAGDVESQQFNQNLETLPSFDSTADLIGHYQSGPWDEGIARAPANTIAAETLTTPWMINAPPAYCPSNLQGQADATYNFIQYTPLMQHYCNSGQTTMQQFNPSMLQDVGSYAVRGQCTSHGHGAPNFSNIYVQPSLPSRSSYLPPFADPSEFNSLAMSERRFGFSHNRDNDAVALTSENFGRLHSPQIIRENEFVQPGQRDDMNIGSR